MNKKTATISFRVTSKTKQDLYTLAKLTDRRVPDLLIKWISEKLELESWQIKPQETLRSINHINI